MPPPSSDKLEKLLSMLDREPLDPFLLYAVGMEHKKLGDTSRAIDFFDRTIAVDSSYCYAYFQRGQTQELAGDAAAAAASYREGVEAARRAGDAHAQQELQAALDLIADG
jgi:tetratricopeptide (TPR) repeat protein